MSEQEPGRRELSMAQKVRIALVATWASVVLVLGFAVYMILRVADEPASNGREVVGFAVLFGGFALMGLVLAVPHTRRLLRLLRETDDV